MSRSREAEAILEGLHRLTRGLDYAGINPTVIELATPQDFRSLVGILAGEAMLMPQHVDESAKVWNQVEVLGLIIRGPAVAHAIPGGYEWR
jgi:hypothetical protein